MARKCKKTDLHTVWTKNMDDTLHEMWLNGKTPRQISKTLGVKPNEVIGRRAHLIKSRAWKIPNFKQTDLIRIDPAAPGGDTVMTTDVKDVVNHPKHSTQANFTVWREHEG